MYSEKFTIKIGDTVYLDDGTMWTVKSYFSDVGQDVFYTITNGISTKFVAESLLQKTRQSYYDRLAEEAQSKINSFLA
jgi:hypothetical protein